ncbi:hypothetical protein DAMA08_050000 [Martiniozyma asiatica (nom. inval.)]|nr:hypothetical protein DAMA08_050000 [Martiniozyma asiatica]
METEEDLEVIRLNLKKFLHNGKFSKEKGSIGLKLQEQPKQGVTNEKIQTKFRKQTVDEGRQKLLDRMAILEKRLAESEKRYKLEQIAKSKVEKELMHKLNESKGDNIALKRKLKLSTDMVKDLKKMVKLKESRIVSLLQEISALKESDMRTSVAGLSASKISGTNCNNGENVDYIKNDLDIYNEIVNIDTQKLMALNLETGELEIQTSDVDFTSNTSASSISYKDTGISEMEDFKTTDYILAGNIETLGDMDTEEIIAAGNSNGNRKINFSVYNTNPPDTGLDSEEEKLLGRVPVNCHHTQPFTKSSEDPTNMPTEELAKIRLY